MTKKIAFIFAPLLLAAGLLVLRSTPQRDRFQAAVNFSVPEGLAEIVAATPDGKTLVYTDSETRKLGWVDISDPKQPRMLGAFPVGQEPTSVAITRDGKWVLGVVNDTPGKLVILNAQTRKLQREIRFSGQPDCIAVSPDGKYAAIAVENERENEDLDMPQAPAGYLLIVDLNGEPSRWSSRRVSLSGLKIRFPGDPEPEYIAINAQGEAAITLQENNAVVIVQLSDGKILESWSCGTVTHAADLQNDNSIAFTEQLTNARREPDGIAWTPNGHLITANEGDYTNDISKKNGEYVGGRNWTIFSREGKVLFDCGDELERQAIRAGVYNDERSHKRGLEPEGVAVWHDKQSTLAFIGCEYGSGGALYDITDEKQPRFLQWLKGGASPEGVLALPQRGLLIAANEGDGTLSIWQAP